MIKKKISTTKLGTIDWELRKGNWNLNPEWQRDDNAFSAKEKNLLIESILDDYPISSIILIGNKRNDNNDKFSFDVIDGKQRLTTIKEFMDNRLIFKTRREEYKCLNNKSYQLFPKKFQDDVENFEIPVIEIDGSLNTSEIRPDIFKRINVGYKKLNKQEIRDSWGTTMGAFINRLEKEIDSITTIKNGRRKYRSIASRCIAVAEMGVSTSINNSCDDLYNIKDDIRLKKIYDKSRHCFGIIKQLLNFKLKNDTEIDAIFTCLYRNNYNKQFLLSENVEICLKLQNLFLSDEWKQCVGGDGHHKEKTNKRLTLVENIFL